MAKFSHNKKKGDGGCGRALIKNSFFAVLLALILMAALFIVGCGINQNSTLKYTDYHVGKYGIMLSLINDRSMDNLYENSTFALSVLLENKGAHDVTPPEQAYLSVSFDPFYINALPPAQNNNVILGRDGKSMIVKGIRLFGKSEYFPTGEQVFLAFSNLNTKPVEGQRAQPTTSLFISLCYPYTTVLSKMICVDMNRYTENLRKQVCTQQDMALTDQGAPVSISKVEIDNQPVSGDLVRPVFIVHVINSGTGNILSPMQNPADVERVCTAADLRREDFNTVAIQAYLSDTLQLTCTPEVIKIYDNEGVTRCSVQDADLQKVVTWHQNYQAPLTINLSYIYQESVSKEITIKRFDIYGGAVSKNNDCQYYETRINGQCISKCSFCASHPSDSSCQPPNSKYAIAFDNSFDCKCSPEDCNTLYPKGLCIPSSSYCPGIGYCCSPACKSGQAKSSVDGKCYPKCSNSCGLVKSACLCDLNAEPITSRYCCPLKHQVYDSGEECKLGCQ